MTLFINKSILFGVSVRGPAHTKAKSKNQDAWLGYKNPSFAIAVVCDGLGSRSHSGVGAKIACWAARDAMQIWTKTPSAPLSFLPKLIKLIWELRLANYNLSDYATTCIVTCLTNSGRLIIAGLGDGIALVRANNGNLSRIIHRDTDFSNRTIALGTPHQLNDWKIFEIEKVMQGTTVLLATDGISDDLMPEKYSEFVEWVMQEFTYLNPIERKKSLRKALRNWPTPLHQDDKSLAVLSYPIQIETLEDGE